MRTPKPAPPAPTMSAAMPPIPADGHRQRKKLARYLPTLRDYRAFRNDTWKISLGLSSSIYEITRNDPADARRRLEKLSKLLSDATIAISELGYDARWKLDSFAGIEIRHEEARKRSENALSYSTETFHDRGHRAVDGLAKEVAHLAHLAENAALGINTPGKGRPPADAYREAVRSLMEVWTEQTGERPTLVTLPSGRKKGVFLDFCREVIDPIYRAHDLEPPNGESVVREVLAANEA